MDKRLGGGSPNVDKKILNVNIINFEKLDTAEGASLKNPQKILKKFLRNSLKSPQKVLRKLSEGTLKELRKSQESPEKVLRKSSASAQKFFLKVQKVQRKS